MATSRSRRAAVYVRVSTHDQEVENQLEELRTYVAARGWEAHEYLDEGVSGALDQRQPSMNWSGTPSGAVSMCCSAGASIGWAGA